MPDARLWRRYDWWLFGAVIVLITLGIVMINSATRGDPQLQRTFINQAITALAGLVLLFIVCITDYSLLQNVAPALYLGMLAALALVLVPGIGKVVNGARRWFFLGSFDLEPGEIAKLVMTLIVAKVIADRQGRSGYLSTLLLSLALIAPCVILIFLQPNLSTALTIVFIWLVMVFVGGLERQHVIIMLLTGVAIVLIVTRLPSFQNYQLSRLEALLGVSQEPGANFQAEQALIALGNGGLLGQGYLLGQQTQLRFFPVRHTDFIFSVIAEELGFVGSAILMVLLLIVILRALRVAMISRDTFGRLTCAGIAAMLFLQTYINLGMQVRLMPVTGIVLPFVSYGRTSLISVMMAIGLVESVAMRYKKLEF